MRIAVTIPILMRTQRVAFLTDAIGWGPLIFITAVSLRLFAAAQLIPSKAQSAFYIPNEPARIAWAMVSGYGFSSPWPHTPLLPSAQQPPLYPLLLAGIFQLTGAYSILSLWIAVTLNAVFSATTAVLILKLGKRVFTRMTGILAAWIWACWVYEVAVSIRLWESSMSALLLACGLLLISDDSSTSSTKTWASLGALWGIAALCNATLLLVFFGFWIVFWVSTRQATPQSRSLLSLGVFLLVLLPWTVRNYAVFGRLIPIRNNFGLELWIGNHDGVTHLYDFRGGFPLIDPTEYNDLGEIRFMESKREVALRFISHNPAQFLRLMGQRFYAFWSEPTAYFWFPIAVLSWFGLVIAAFKRSLDAVPYAIVILLFPVVYYVTHPWSTYRHPIEPEILLLAIYGVLQVGKVVSRLFLVDLEKRTLA